MFYPFKWHLTFFKKSDRGEEEQLTFIVLPSPKLHRSLWSENFLAAWPAVHGWGEESCLLRPSSSHLCPTPGRVISPSHLPRWLQPHSSIIMLRPPPPPPSPPHSLSCTVYSCIPPWVNSLPPLLRIQHSYSRSLSPPLRSSTSSRTQRSFFSAVPSSHLFLASFLPSPLHLSLSPPLT